MVLKGKKTKRLKGLPNKVIIKTLSYDRDDLPDLTHVLTQSRDHTWQVMTTWHGLALHRNQKRTGESSRPRAILDLTPHCYWVSSSKSVYSTQIMYMAHTEKILYRQTDLTSL